MRWKFWKRNQPFNFKVSSEEIPVSTILRWYCYDLDIEDTNNLVTEFNLIPVSEEGEEHERKESDERMKEVTQFFPFFDLMSEINSRAITALQLKELPTEMQEVGPEVLELMYKHVSLSALISSFSTAIALGLVHSNPTLINMMEGKYE
jgi:hypothetical protein